MCRILPAIESLNQYLYYLKHHADAYRPSHCPHCGFCKVWRHGHYFRKADREGKEGVYLDPVPIPRFYCCYCQMTFSRLPACIAPRRWYLWATQQAVLVLLLNGYSLHQVARMCRPGRRTIGRWWEGLKSRFQEHTFHLRNRFSELGSYLCFSSFWSACLEQMSLADAMGWLERDGVDIP